MPVLTKQAITFLLASAPLVMCIWAGYQRSRDRDRKRHVEKPERMIYGGGMWRVK